MRHAGRPHVFVGILSFYDICAARMSGGAGGTKDTCRPSHYALPSCCRRRVPLALRHPTLRCGAYTSGAGRWICLESSLCSSSIVSAGPIRPYWLPSQVVTTTNASLVAKIYYAKRKIVWEILDGTLKKKLEIGWQDIASMHVDHSVRA